jgi:hypothetical protein
MALRRLAGTLDAPPGSGSRAAAGGAAAGVAGVAGAACAAESDGVPPPQPTAATASRAAERRRTIIRGRSGLGARRELLQESVDAAVGERVDEERAKRIESQGDRVGACEAARGEIRRAARVCRDEVALGARAVEQEARLVDDDDAVLPQPVELVDGDRHGGRARLAREQRLRGVERERRRDAYALAGEAADRHHRVVHERHLDDDAVGDLRELAAVAVDVVRIHRRDARVHGQRDRPADLAEQLARVGAGAGGGGEGRAR